MENRSVISLFTLILVIFGLFAACSNSTNSTNSDDYTVTYRVTFEANGGSPVPSPKYVAHGGKVTMPPAMTKTGYDFGGWYKEADCINQWDFDTDTVTGNITLYAKWEEKLPIIVPGNTLYAKLQWLGTNVASDSTYIFEITADESLGPQELVFPGKSNITIQLQGIGSNRVIKLSGNGSLFTIKEGVTLILDKNLILLGIDDNYRYFRLVNVSDGGKLTMNQGAKITGNTGGGVHLGDLGTFTMNGGEISGNTASSGGGVYIGFFGTFTMNGGKISGNTASSGGGVHINSDSTFTMNGGEISGNTASSGGGGVYVSRSIIGGGTFFTMSGGEISGNTASSGGGVYVDSSGTTFTKSGGGTITGYANDTVNGNVVKNSSGVVQNDQGHAVAVYVYSRPDKRKEITAGPGDNLDSTIGGAMGGWD
jgi:uncharacterized repeat protein (TIGR02543 family)